MKIYDNLKKYFIAFMGIKPLVLIILLILTMILVSLSGCVKKVNIPFKPEVVKKLENTWMPADDSRKSPIYDKERWHSYIKTFLNPEKNGVIGIIMYDNKTESPVQLVIFSKKGGAIVLDKKDDWKRKFYDYSENTRINADKKAD